MASPQPPTPEELAALQQPNGWLSGQNITLPTQVADSDVVLPTQQVGTNRLTLPTQNVPAGITLPTQEVPPAELSGPPAALAAPQQPFNMTAPQQPTQFAVGNVGGSKSPTPLYHDPNVAYESAEESKARYDREHNAVETIGPNKGLTIDQVAGREAEAASRKQAEKSSDMTAKTTEELRGLLAKPGAPTPQGIPAPPGATGGGQGVNGGPINKWLKGHEDNQAKREDSFAETQLANEHIANAEIAGRQAAAKLENDQVAADAVAQAQSQADRNQAKTSSDETFAKLEKRMADMKDIDPNHWWNHQSTGGKILAGLSIALGALGSGITAIHSKATPNYALDMINNSINHDIDSQKTNMEKEWHSITAGMSINKDKWAQAQWTTEQQNRERLMGWNKVQHQLSALTATTDSQEVMDRATIVNQGIEQQKIDTRDKMVDHRYTAAQTLSAQAAAGQNAARASYDKMTTAYRSYSGKELEEGRQPLPFTDWHKVVWSGEGGATPQGNANDAYKDDRKAIQLLPKEQRAGATKALDKRIETDKSVTYIGELGDRVAEGSLTEHPTNIVGVQGTPGADAKRNVDTYNSALTIILHQTSPGIRSPELIEETTRPYKITPWDSKATIQKKVTAFKGFISKNAGGDPDEDAASGVPGAVETGK